MAWGKAELRETLDRKSGLLSTSLYLLYPVDAKRQSRVAGYSSTVYSILDSAVLLVVLCMFAPSALEQCFEDDSKRPGEGLVDKLESRIPIPPGRSSAA
jgi:hypothetical protein